MVENLDLQTERSEKVTDRVLQDLFEVRSLSKYKKLNECIRFISAEKKPESVHAVRWHLYNTDIAMSGLENGDEFESDFFYGVSKTVDLLTRPLGITLDSTVTQLADLCDKPEYGKKMYYIGPLILKIRIKLKESIYLDLPPVVANPYHRFYIETPFPHVTVELNYLPWERNIYRARINYFKDLKFNVEDR